MCYSIVLSKLDRFTLTTFLWKKSHSKCIKCRIEEGKSEEFNTEWWGIQQIIIEDLWLNGYGF